MMRWPGLLMLIPALYCLGIAEAGAQSYPAVDRVAQRVVEKYRSSSCQELAFERSRPPTGERAEEEKRAVQLLHDDPRMRKEFLDRVAAPIANKLFECGMIP